MLLDIVIDVIKYGIISLVLLGVLAWIIILAVRKAKSFRVDEIDGKYSPMMGKKYLCIHKDTGMIGCKEDQAECMKFDTIGEARIIYEAFKNQRKNRRQIPAENEPANDTR